ncbi:hypothetical protein P3T23_006366 [Paraburkholderia sp. GAS448]
MQMPAYVYAIHQLTTHAATWRLQCFRILKVSPLSLS